jgi:hypothetical protein
LSDLLVQVNKKFGETQEGQQTHDQGFHITD